MKKVVVTISFKNPRFKNRRGISTKK